MTKDEILQLRLDGLSFSDIGRKAGTSPQAVHDRIRGETYTLQVVMTVEMWKAVQQASSKPNRKVLQAIQSELDGKTH